MLFDVFCRVIDNHGDVGVCWRLCRELGERGHAVRLWIDDDSALAWMAPKGHPAVTVIPAKAGIQGVRVETPGDVVIEAFGCELPGDFIHAMAGRGSTWINLEYLSAEPYVERSHGLRSPVRDGLDKFFFYPGFTPRTGGLLREQDLAARQAAFVRPSSDERRVSLFCYEPAVLDGLLRQLAGASVSTRLLVTAGRAHAAARAAIARLDALEPGWNAGGQLIAEWLPLLSQRSYDELLWTCDFNFVRGEDSLVRALWAGRPFAWQLYPQDDGAHFAKLRAFLDWLQPPPALRDLFLAWNGAPGAELPDFDPPAWQDAAQAAQAARDRALALPELAGALLRFADRGRI
ncbi:elongation factor P maturation arginine rhamnosyltransferase EarP [Ramlibacter sp.]|uniref:elongation factor P maturation arginine rhamnosyltransferase EarP n=1 Tax=Ramlibacter sp. TaxID=1917967 RepID=UPI003D0E53FA